MKFDHAMYSKVTEEGEFDARGCGLPRFGLT